MLYTSRFMKALAELEGAIVHEKQEEEDAMFDKIKQSKREGMKPAEAAISYFITEAQRGIASNPDSWRLMTHEASRRVRSWSMQGKVGHQYAEMLFDLLQDTEPDEA